MIIWTQKVARNSPIMSRKEIKEPIARRRHAFNRAISFIRDNSQSPIMILRLCKKSQVSWRTLDFVFKENFEISPNMHLMAARLNGIRKALLKTDSGLKVVRIAHDSWLLAHGLFAKEYRDSFSEPPSETLIKNTLR
jgi:transcriptional regulator GlxA family with amidase domain